eukprot:CAMPEP_0197040568 /NCGR_PEP_ID=MMETSP1384-20130603/17253_1 /TAXON_ID=29189 /ORGANISM="Ammonia sp." /LENGTH=149 /DNA_ID=CAMNT_0042471349 /DNA_START=22 /DNA_END=471 /DNA_ORIENTATION=-
MGIGQSIADSMKSSMKDSMKENSKTMIENQKRMQMQVREMQMAVNMARMRDLFKWYASFAGTVFVLGAIGAAKTKTPLPLIPSLPLGWVAAYQYDMAYGNKLNRVRQEAGQILDEKWRLGDENPFLLPENNLLMDQLTYLEYTKRDESQ